MEEIGGYFHLELNRICNFSHYGGILLNSGRCSFEYILTQLSVKKIFLPFYTCEVVLEPILRRGIKYEFYNIDSNLEIRDCLELGRWRLCIIYQLFWDKRSLCKTIGKCV